MQIIETTEPTDWQAANVQSSAKRKGKGGDFILHNGDYIFTRSSIIFNEPVDVFLDADTAETKKPVIERVDVATGEIMS